MGAALVGSANAQWPDLATELSDRRVFENDQTNTLVPDTARWLDESLQTP